MAKKMKNVLLMGLSFVLVAALAIGGTIAYLTDTDSDVNVMTLGNVKIQQLEYERVVEDGSWISTGETDKYGYIPDEIQKFTQAKPILPAVYADGIVKYDDRATTGGRDHQQSWGQIDASGSNQLMDDSVKNVQDKFVFVENTGKTDAYVRTLIAFEIGSHDAKVQNDTMIHTVGDLTHWEWSWLEKVEINGNKYDVACVTYKGATSNPNGVLAAGKVSYPSLLQVFLDPAATNDDVEKIDGNDNGTYDILVLSQAVQADGFTNAQTALDAGFGGVDVANVAKWFGDEKLEIPTVADDENALNSNLKNGSSVVLSDDIEVQSPAYTSGTWTFAVLANGNLNGNGYEITDATKGFTGLYVAGSTTEISNLVFDSDSQLATNFQNRKNEVLVKDCTITGKDAALYFQGACKVVIENVTATADGIADPALAQGTVFATKNTNDDASIVTIKSGTYEATGEGAAVVWSHHNSVITIEGGFFTGLLKVSTDGQIVIKGGTFNVDPTSFLADGYKATRTGDVWTVTAK